MAEEVVKDETVKEESVQVTETFDDLLGQSEPKPEVPVKGVEEKVPAVDTKSEEKSEDSQKDEKSDDKTDKTKKLEDAKAVIDWSSDDNPLKKQLKDTRDYATQVNQRNLELEKTTFGLDRKVDILGKKIDGTYDEESEKANAPTEDQIRADGEFQGRLNASKAQAVKEYGSEKTEALLNEFHSRFNGDEIAQNRVRLSGAPVMEAMTILKQAAWTDLHGSDPEKIEVSIRSKYEEELVKSITERVTKEISDRYTKQGNDMQGLSEVKGSQDQEKPETSGVTPLSELFKS